VAFYIVYIQEAHSVDGWQMGVNVKQNVLLAYTRTDEDRQKAAESCTRNLKIDIPALLDDAGNSTEKAYTGWPDRLYAIDSEGIVRFKSKPGPFGFHPEDLSSALQQMLH
jgi:hypothetical protein